MGRRLLLPAMSPKAVTAHQPFVRELCWRLIDSFIAEGQTDAAVDYAQQNPLRVVAALTGIPQDSSDQFVGWVRSISEFAHDIEGRKHALLEVRSLRPPALRAGLTISSTATSLASFLVPWTARETWVDLPSTSLPV